MNLRVGLVAPAEAVAAAQGVTLLRLERQFLSTRPFGIAAHGRVVWILAVRHADGRGQDTWAPGNTRLFR